MGYVPAIQPDPHVRSRCADGEYHTCMTCMSAVFIRRPQHNDQNQSYPRGGHAMKQSMQ